MPGSSAFVPDVWQLHGQSLIRGAQGWGQDETSAGAVAKGVRLYIVPARTDRSQPISSAALSSKVCCKISNTTTRQLPMKPNLSASLNLGPTGCHSSSHQISSSCHLIPLIFSRPPIGRIRPMSLPRCRATHGATSAPLRWRCHQLHASCLAPLLVRDISTT